jgi:SAM-dependent methyltransferase
MTPRRAARGRLAGPTNELLKPTNDEPLKQENDEPLKRTNDELLKPMNGELSKPMNGELSKPTSGGPLKKIRAVLAAPPEPFLVTARSKRRLQALVDSTPVAAIVLNVGAGYTFFGPRVVNVDIFDSGTTTVIASALALPFADGCADLVILQGVLEHVRDAERTLAECYRVLKPGGLFYTEMPFLQPYHESPIDMRRATRPGLSHLCAPLEEVESGIHIGPASALTWMLKELLARLVSGGNFDVYRRAAPLIGWVVFPLRYADYVLERIPHLDAIASSCYYLGRKTQG